MHHAYGLEVHGLGTSSGLVGSRRHHWHRVSLRREVGAPPPASALEWSHDEVRLDAAERLSVTVRRTAAKDGDPMQGLVATISAPDMVDDEDVEHPLLAFVGGVVARWSGRTALHGAAVVLEERSWVLVGAPGSGKSTLAAALSGRGHAVQTDDLAVVSQGTVFGGPRSCDLRDASARVLGRGRPVRRHGQPRWRSRLGDAPHEAALAGVIDLRWGDRLAIERVPPAERLGVLARSEGFGRGPSEPTSFLRLLSVPVLALTRTRSFDDLDRGVALVESVASR